MIVDLFAGPGGWDVGAHALGLDPIGIEWDDAAVATRHAAGLRTVQADVGALDPADYAPADGLIASPPCQAFSMAGKGAGRKATRALDEAMADLGLGRPIDRDALDAACQDERAHLVLEPLRWALALTPRWVACEQVEPVLPLWESMAAVLRRHGYAVWTGVLSAERYGVPQTRRRAILLARRDGNVTEPPGTHQRYVAPRRRDEATLGLFDAPEPERIVLAEEEHLLPWVSMAEALGWTAGVPIDHHRGAGMTERYGERVPRHTGQPAPTVTAGAGRRSGGTRWTVQTSNFTAIARDADGKRSKAGSIPYTRPIDDPAPTLTGDASAWKLRASFSDEGTEKSRERPLDEPAPTVTGEACYSAWKLRANAQANAAERGLDEPAPTITGGHDHADRQWVPTHLDARVSHAQARHVTEPAPTQTSKGLSNGVGVWTDDPATETTPGTGYRPTKGVRVEQAEALVLQSFPPDYPVQGTKSKRFEQIGNAVPPLLALACLQAVSADAGADDEQEAAA